MRIITLTSISMLFCSLSFVSFAGNETKLTNQLTQCGQISPADARLACFDDLLKGASTRAVLPANNATALVATVPTTIAQVQPSATKQVDDFAKEHLKKTSTEQGLDSITSPITKLKKLIRGQWVISLENGQQWQQKDTTKMKLKVGDTVRMKKAAMGAVYLYKEGSHRNIRVKRLK
ncbi:hypothetical protein A9Q74_03115 [Colwellia sp. 39_35_sub15_T18]|nr:hypothetical protein A9Q74_03115 [Colwellia sp. 39_35_sub15_T18]